MAKKGKGKIPKKIAGVKVPKALRKALAGSLVDNPRAREILADVLIAAAGAAAAALVQNRPTGQQIADAGAGAATATRDMAQGAAGAVGEVVAEAARTILPASLVSDGSEGKGKGKRDKTESYARLLDEDRKDKKDKRPKASNH